MSTAQQLESIANTLETYRTHLAAVSHALNALRTVSEEMIEALDRDRAALATHLQLAADTAMIQPVEIAEQPVQSDVASTDPVEVENSWLAEVEESEPSASMSEIEPTTAEVSASSEAAEIEPAREDITVAEIEAVETVATEIEPTETKAVETETQEIEATVVLAAATEDAAPAAEAEAAKPETATDEAKPAATEEPGNVVSLATRRKSRIPLSPARRRALAAVASLLLCTTATLGTYEFMQTEMGQQLLQLSSCDGDMLSAQRDCNLLSWLHI